MSSPLLGLRTIVYPVPDLAPARDGFAELLGVEPYFDEPFYVGFDVGGYELGLVPSAGGDAAPVTYWGVPDVDAALARLLETGARPHDEVRDVGGGIRTASVAGPAGAVLGIIENPSFRPAERPAEAEGPGR